MVHVMSEVNVYGVAKSALWDSIGNPACFSSETMVVLKSDFDAVQAKNVELCEAHRVAQKQLGDLWKELDAQRLRADTAEAERDDLKKHQGILLQGAKYARSRRDYWLKRGDKLQNDLAAAEQRIAELVEFLTTATMPIVDDEKFCIERILVFDNAKAYLSSLNPNPEAESHE